MSRELNAFLNDRSTLKALEDHYQRAVEAIVREMAYGMSRPGAARAQALVRRIDELLATMNTRRQEYVRNWIKRNASRAFVIGDRNATAKLRTMLRNVGSGKAADFGDVNTSWTAINNTSLAAIARAMQESLQVAPNEIRRITSTAIRASQVTLNQNKKIMDATVGGLIRGRTGQQVADDIASIFLKGRTSPEVRKRLMEIGYRGEMFESFEKIARGEMIRVGQKTMSVRSYANLVARTQLREMSRVATVTRLNQNGVYHVKVTRPPQKEIDECAIYAGKVFYVGPLSKDPMGFPPLSSTPNGGPPFHPHCIHDVNPFVVPFHGRDEVLKQKEQSGKIPRTLLNKTFQDVKKNLAGMTAQERRALGDVA